MALSSLSLSLAALSAAAVSLAVMRTSGSHDNFGAFYVPSQLYTPAPGFRSQQQGIIKIIECCQ